MGFFDSLKKLAGNAIRKGANEAINNAVRTVGKGKNSSQTFKFSVVPTSLGELKALPEASLDSAFKTTALTILALCNFEQDESATVEMLNFLKGPEDVSTYEKNFIKERLKDKQYITRSYFAGATPENGYAPSLPYTVTVYENPYSFDNDGWAVLWLKSSGADHMRQIKLRKKPSTGQWFLNDIQCLSEIRIPVAEDKWA